MRFLILMLFALPAVSQPVVFIDGEKSNLVAEHIDLRSGIDCQGDYHWSAFDPYYRGQLDDICIDISTLEGIHYDVCNGLGTYVAVTQWQAAGNKCWTPDEIENGGQCDGFSPQPPGCE
jgi:hypothetical protein